jgi:hypothetical protein
MQAITFDQVYEFIDQASYLQPTIDGGDKTVHFGIDDQGREFVLIVSAMTGKGKLGIL